MQEYENNLKKELDEKKKEVDLEKADLQRKEQESLQELEEIKDGVEAKKDTIIDFIITNIMNVNMQFPEMVKKRFVKKKKGKNKA